MSGNITPFTDNITSEHADKPNFVAMVGQTCQPSADLIELYNQIPLLYDVDVAVGTQLDVDGQWVGVSRYLNTPLTGVYFSFDILGVGFDEGVWLGPFDPITGLTRLPDDIYRILIKVKILNNHWNGSKNDAYTIFNTIFAQLGYSFFIEDYSDLSFNQGLIGPSYPVALVIALLTSGKLNVKPAGIRIRNYIYQSVPGPIFAFDINNSSFAGFDTGGWAIIIPN